MTNRSENPFQHLQTVPVGQFRFIALDVETASRSAGSICQIGIACVANDNSIQTYSTLIDPQCAFDPFNIDLHGIGPDTVRRAPVFSAGLETLLPLLTAHPLIQHSSFDKRAIEAACDVNNLPAPALTWSDSVTIARRAWPELRGNGGHGLANLKKVLDLSFHHHDAGEDARAAAMVVLHAEHHVGAPFHEIAQPKRKPRKPA
jgi:DNA polymerase-3 subunit epsilon